MLSGKKTSELYWLQTPEKLDLPTCEHADAKFLALTYYFTQHPSVLPVVSLQLIAETKTSARLLHKYKIIMPTNNWWSKQKRNTVKFGLSTAIAIDSIYAGTIIDYNRPHRPFLNERKRILDSIKQLQSIFRGENSEFYYQAIENELKRAKDPISLLTQYLRQLGLQPDETQMRKNSKTFLKSK